MTLVPNLQHHAYLLEGDREEISSELLKFFEKENIKVLGNPDFIELKYDSFKIEDARALKSFEKEKSLQAGRKIFLISANSFLREAQNALLKMFEEPIPETHFFIIVREAASILPTLRSRFYFISARPDLSGSKEAEEFLTMTKSQRIEYLKELLRNEESAKTRALKFLNELESTLQGVNLSRITLDSFEQIFKVRKYLRQPGSSAKTLMESVALMVPHF